MIEAARADVGGQQALDERGALARHPRARHDEVEARPQRGGARVRRRRASRRRACAWPQLARRRGAAPARRRRRPSQARSTIERVAPSGTPRRPRRRDLVAGRTQHRASTLEPKQQVVGRRATTRATPTATARGAAELLRAPTRGRPHIWVRLDAARAHLAEDELAVDAGVVEQLQRAVHGGRRRGVAEAVGDEQPPVPVVLRVRLRVAGHEVASRRRRSASRPGCAGRARGRSSRRAASRRSAGTCRRAPSPRNLRDRPGRGRRRKSRPGRTASSPHGHADRRPRRRVPRAHGGLRPGRPLRARQARAHRAPRRKAFLARPGHQRHRGADARARLLRARC